MSMIFFKKTSIFGEFIEQESFPYNNEKLTVITTEDMRYPFIVVKDNDGYIMSMTPPLGKLEIWAE